ncbi:expressed unknown protein [Seminavis robusta]|uniref:Uncharacterized protein n=1 Tax=Seminavis robusta TaxID=568900 RepID=A0A9N8E8J8_9STRA|nr:expressed unknown protein [Seminavis robusta]|eukprot:Sro801_g204540.1 n/a (206) ;mRNA; r:45325-46025
MNTSDSNKHNSSDDNNDINRDEDAEVMNTFQSRSDDSVVEASSGVPDGSAEEIQELPVLQEAKIEHKPHRLLYFLPTKGQMEKSKALVPPALPTVYGQHTTEPTTGSQLEESDSVVLGNGEKRSEQKVAEYRAGEASAISTAQEKVHKEPPTNQATSIATQSCHRDEHNSEQPTTIGSIQEQDAATGRASVAAGELLEGNQQQVC